MGRRNYAAECRSRGLFSTYALRRRLTPVEHLVEGWSRASDAEKCQFMAWAELTAAPGPSDLARAAAALDAMATAIDAAPEG